MTKQVKATKTKDGWLVEKKHTETVPNKGEVKKIIKANGLEVQHNRENKIVAQ